MAIKIVDLIYPATKWWFSHRSVSLPELYAAHHISSRVPDVDLLGRRSLSMWARDTTSRCPWNEPTSFAAGQPWPHGMPWPSVAAILAILRWWLRGLRWIRVAMENTFHVRFILLKMCFLSRLLTYLIPLCKIWIDGWGVRQHRLFKKNPKQPKHVFCSHCRLCNLELHC